MVDVLYEITGGRSKRLKDMSDGSYAEVVYTGGGAAVAGTVAISQTTPGTTNAVAPISGQAGVAGGAGANGATVQRVTLATDDSFVTAAASTKVGVRQRLIDAAVTTLTRATNQTPYSINDSISDNATPGSVTALVATVSDTNDAPVMLTHLRVDTNDTGLAAGVFLRAHLFNSDPTASSGVAGGDNLAYSNKRAGWIGAMSGSMRAFSDGGRAVLVPEDGSYIICVPGTGSGSIWVQYQTLTAFTPSANSTTIDARLKGIQGRA
jgi:hypothetical protein